MSIISEIRSVGQDEVDLHLKRRDLERRSLFAMTNSVSASLQHAHLLEEEVDRRCLKQSKPVCS